MAEPASPAIPMTCDTLFRCRETPHSDVLNQHTVSPTTVMSQDIARQPDLRIVGSAVCHFAGGAFGCSGGLVVAGGVDGQLAEEFAGGGVDDADVEVLDEQDDAGSGVGSADADVVQPAGDAQGDVAGCVDAVVADPVVGVGAAVAGRGWLWAGVVGGRGGGPVRQGPVRAVVVVVVDEGVEQGLQLGDRGRAGRVGRRATSSGSAGSVRPCRRWWGGWGGSSSGRCRGGAVRSRSALRPPRPPASRVVKTMPLSVSVEAGISVRPAACGRCRGRSGR